MQCPTCNASLKERSTFCEHCGGALPRICVTFGHANSVLARFCSECGSGLARSKRAMAPSTSPSATARVAPASSAGRRQLTIMFCDMVGSSALSTRLDPDEQRDGVSASSRAAPVRSRARRHGRAVARRWGTGLFRLPDGPTAPSGLAPSDQTLTRLWPDGLRSAGI
jgi:hypothetical protein